LRQSGKLALIADQEDLLAGNDAGDEVLAFGKFTTELFSGVDRRVNLSANLSLRFGHRRDDISEREVVANHHDIHIASGGFGSRRHRAKDEGNADAVRHTLQSLSYSLGGSEGLANDTVKIREYWTLAIRLEVNLAALHSSGEDPGSRKEFQISLHGA
jgi:hypothetical protein